MKPDIPMPKQALEAAARQYVGPKEEGEAEGADGPRGPVVVMDVGDNIGGGSAADSTFMLREAIAQKISPYLQSMYDPAAAAVCHDAGVGATVTLSLGGHTGACNSTTLQPLSRFVSSWQLPSRPPRSTDAL